MTRKEWDGKIPEGATVIFNYPAMPESELIDRLFKQIEELQKEIYRLRNPERYFFW